MKTKIFFLTFIFIFQINFCFAGNQLINSYKDSIKNVQRKISELSNYTEKQGIVKDLEYFEKLLEKYEYIVEKNTINVKAFKELIKCKENGKTCLFLGNNTNNLSLEKLNDLKNKAVEEKHMSEIKLEDLQKTLDYLNESKKEIEEREKKEGKKSKFEIRNNNSVKTYKNINNKTGKIKENKNIEKDYKIKKRKEKKSKKILENFKTKTLDKLNKITKGYSLEYKNKIYFIAFRKLSKMKKTEKINIVLEILKEKIEATYD